MKTKQIRFENSTIDVNKKISVKYAVKTPLGNLLVIKELSGVEEAFGSLRFTYE